MAGNLELVVGVRGVDATREDVAGEEDLEAVVGTAIGRSKVHPRNQGAAELVRGIEREVAWRLERQRRGQLGRDIAADDCKAAGRQVQGVAIEQITSRVDQTGRVGKDRANQRW